MIRKLSISGSLPGVMFSVGLALFSSFPSQAADCGRADTLFNMQSQEMNQSHLLEVLDLCPVHAGALNNLALIRETSGDLPEAASLYRRAIMAGGGAPPQAGLGDVLATQGDRDGAARAYTIFLELAAEEVANGDPNGLADHVPLYQQRLAALTAQDTLKSDEDRIDDIGGNGNAGSSDQLVSAAEMTRGLTRKPLGTRGMSVIYHEEPHIDVPILFDHDSDRIKQEDAAQIQEIARSLKTPYLARVRIMIEGHTDSVGDGGYNLALSQRRAQSVRLALMALGVSGDRLYSVGRGETQAIAENDTAAGRSLNRRVTFVNLGGE